MGYRLCVTGRFAGYSLIKHARLETRGPLKRFKLVQLLAARGLALLQLLLWPGWRRL